MVGHDCFTNECAGVCEGDFAEMATTSELHPGFSSYVRLVEDAAADALRSGEFNTRPSWTPEMLDGQAAHELRETVPLDVRKRLGAFFSSSTLRAAVVPSDIPETTARVSVLDPAVGAGDLLIEAARHMPVCESLEATLDLWGSLLHGRDVQPEFVQLAKARLVLLAVSRGAVLIPGNSIRLHETLPGVQVGDGLETLSQKRDWGRILMNPPFAYHSVPEEAWWSSGRTNAAATFLARVVECAGEGTQVTAVLPDVIRTGSRYERLRNLVGRRMQRATVKIFGQFDAWTDVDVFILNAVVSDANLQRRTVDWWRRVEGETIGDHFNVSVGSVVPHRDPETAPERHYLHARSIPIGGEFDVSSSERRGFQKRALQPPFVIVRRTSRPGDRLRGKGTLICGTEAALVENHLIVLKPKDGSIHTCRDVICRLDSDRARQWLDERIRCRHLTVGAVREIPWI